ncbi:D-inositol-3-phosphate glycosyltransferase [Gryllotalpicola daejeonensis]|uniref:D-inositol 3-phosphate glycosyltransferase n=1 Tax=Gryllotalpicola daejeonensis TaxID=993087 RepID=A0ABP7ZL10_9MICO
MSVRIGLVSLHTSPLDTPGRGDAGGMNVVVRALADELAKAGHHVEVLTRAASAGDLGRVETLDSGARVRFLAAGDAAPLAKGELPQVTGEFGRALRELPRFDVLHAHYWLSGRAALPVARDTGAAHVLSLHTVAVVKNARLARGDAPEPRARIDAERMLACRSDAVVASTRSERDAVVAAYGASPRCVEIIPPGVDTEIFHPRSASESSSLARTARAVADVRQHSGPSLVCVGRIQPLKGQDLAIRALSRLAPGIRPRLVIAGEVSGAGSERYRAELDRLIAARGLEHDVEFVGAVPRHELAALIAGSTLVVVPSHSETYGLVTLEAAACGVPVVAAAAPGLSDAVRAGATGVLVAGRDERSWAAAIERLLRDPGRRALMPQASVAHARAHAWKATAARLATLYERVAGAN